MKITYKVGVNNEMNLEPNYRLEEILTSILRLFQYEFVGSGYSFETGERDLEFENKLIKWQRQDNK